MASDGQVRRIADMSKKALKTAPRGPRPVAPNRIAELRRAADMTQAQLGEAVGAHWTTISDLERGVQQLTEAWMRRLAPPLKVAISELIALDNEEVYSHSMPLLGFISAGGSIDTSTEQVREGAQFEAVLMLRFKRDSVAFQVVGNSMLPAYKPDVIIICEPYNADVGGLLGQDVVVRTGDGRRYLKQIHAGSRSGLYDLYSLNDPVIRDVSIEWIGEIVAIIPASRWKLLDKTYLDD